MSTDDSTLRVRLDDADTALDETQASIEALERGDDIESRQTLTLTDDADLSRLVSETNLELLRAILEHEPKSMRQAASLVDRDYRDVHRNLTELASMRVVELVDDGRSRRPVVRFDAIEISIDLSLKS